MWLTRIVPNQSGSRQMPPALGRACAMRREWRPMCSSPVPVWPIHAPPVRSWAAVLPDPPSLFSGDTVLCTEGVTGSFLH